MTCGGVTYWHDEAWVCDQCGDEFYPDPDFPLYDPPGGPYRPEEGQACDRLSGRPVEDFGHW